MDPVEALALCGGAARWKRLREIGVPERALAAALRCGAVRSLGRGGYALPGAPLGLVAAVELGGVASHVNAAVLHGWPLWTPDERIVVTLLSGTARSRPGVEIHHSRLERADLERYRALTGPLRTALDCARSLSFVNAVCLLDAALRRGAVTEHQLVEAARRSRGPGALALRRAIANVDPRAGSPLESVLRLLLRAGGGLVRSQVWIEGVGTVDFVVDEWLVVEGDGFEFHSDRASYRTDRHRGNGLTARGYGWLRFTYEDVRGRPLWVIAQVERVRLLRTVG